MTTPKSMMWLTDTHLDFLLFEDGTPKDERFEQFVEAVNSHKPELVLITGDITNGAGFKTHMKMLEERFTTCSKIFYVLGNHDFYGSSISNIRKQAVEELNTNKLVYLSSIGYVPLSDNTALVGHDGWYDGQYGNWFSRSTVLMNDYLVISEFKERWYFPYDGDNDRMVKVHSLMQKLAKECEHHILQNLAEAASKYKNVVFATHVPPFIQNSVHDGKISDASWLPNFSSKLAGDALLQVAKAYPNTNFVVLCGHSHGKAEYRPLPNMESYTGFSQYGVPEASIQMTNVEW